MQLELSKEDWVLLALRQAPLDRLRLMKTLFLIWIDSGRNIQNYFEFRPYLYGPCSFELYGLLEEMEDSRLIIQPPRPTWEWGKYYLTKTGVFRCNQATERAGDSRLGTVKSIVGFTAAAGFRELLDKVYAVAPEFAVKSVIR